MSELISIIIPAYNASLYIDRCIKSILSQSYEMCEIIIIDDGSLDNTFSICKEIANKDKRVKVFTKINEGPGAAREYGLSVSTGRYITFVDADDYIDEDLYKIALDALIKATCDIVEWGYREVNEIGKLIREEILQEEVNKNEDCSIHYARQKNVTNFLWNKLFRRELFDDVVFPHYYAGEDTCILTQLYINAKKVVTIKPILYNYVLTDNSLCRKEFNIKRLDSVAAGKFVYQIYMNKFPELAQYAAYYICAYSSQCYIQLRKSNIENKDEILREVLMEFKYFYSLIRKSDNSNIFISIKRKAMVRLFSISPRLAEYIYKIIVN